MFRTIRSVVVACATGKTPSKTPQPTMDRSEESIQRQLEIACSAGQLQRVQSLLGEWKSISPSLPPMQLMLNIATRQSHPALVSFLLNNGATIDSSATVSACVSDSTEVLDAYLGAGFDPNLTVGHQGDPLIMCVGANKTPLVKWLLAHGADPNANMISMTHSALEVAAMHASPEIADLLVKHGAELEGTSALKRAAYYGRLDMILYLLKQGLDINGIPDNDHILDAERRAGLGSALHEAAKNGQVDAVRLLLERGANPNLKNSQGKTPLECALQKGHENVAEIFESVTSIAK